MSPSRQKKDPKDVYPFEYVPQHKGCCQMIKMVIVGLILLIPRALLMCFGLFMAWLISTMMMCCVGHEAMAAFPLVRPIARWLLRKCARIMLFAMGFWWISVDDRRDPVYKKNQPKPTVVIGNHHTFIDGFAMISQENVSPVGKASIMDMPVFGKVFRAIQVCPVDRLSRESNRETAEKIKTRARWMRDQPPEVIQRRGNWPALLIFPEGTNTNCESIIQFKVGAFLPMMPVQPLLLDFKQNHLNLSWVADMSVLNTTIMMFCQVYNHLTVIYLPTEVPTAEDTAFTFMDRSRINMADALSIPLTDHSYHDVVLQMDALDLCLSPQATAAVDVGALGLPIEEVRAKLKEFSRLDKNGDGAIDVDEFADFMGLEAHGGGARAGDNLSTSHHDATRMIRSLLKTWDVDGDGAIDLNEFLLFNKCLQASLSEEEYNNGGGGGGSSSCIDVPPQPTASPHGAALLGGAGGHTPPPMSLSSPLNSPEPSSAGGSKNKNSSSSKRKEPPSPLIDVTDGHQTGSSMPLRRLFVRYFKNMIAGGGEGSGAGAGTGAGEEAEVRRQQFVSHITMNLRPAAASALAHQPRRPSATSDEDANWLFNTMTHNPRAETLRLVEFLDYCHQHPAVVITLFTAATRHNHSRENQAAEVQDQQDQEQRGQAANNFRGTHSTHNHISPFSENETQFEKEHAVSAPPRPLASVNAEDNGGGGGGGPTASGDRQSSISLINIPTSAFQDESINSNSEQKNILQSSSSNSGVGGDGVIGGGFGTGNQSPEELTSVHAMSPAFSNDGSESTPQSPLATTGATSRLLEGGGSDAKDNELPGAVAEA